MVVNEIDVKLIDVPENYMYVKHKRNTCEAIRISGIMMPLVVRPKNGRYELIDGAERLMCAKELGMKAVPAIVVDDDRQDVLRLALNYVRGRVCGIDLLISVWQMLQAYDSSIVKAVLGKSWDTLNKYRNAAEHIIQLRLSRGDIEQLREECISVRKLISCAYSSYEPEDFMNCALSKSKPRLKKVTAEAVQKAVALEKDQELKEAVDIAEAIGPENVKKIAEVVDVMRKTLCSRLYDYAKCMLIDDYKLLKMLCGEK
jgi:hypothetical protein